MKKRTYSKPELLVERFDLTQCLSNCSVLIGFQNQMCILRDTDSTPNLKNYAANGIFSPDPHIGCGDGNFIDDKDFEDGICYHTSVNLIFTS